jgi:transposase
VVTDDEVRRLMKALKKGKSLAGAAARAEMDRKTARKYRNAGLLPSQMKKEHTWRTREDRLASFTTEIEEILRSNFAVEGKTIFEYLNRKYESALKTSDLRTIQRRIKLWRVVDGPSKEVMFPQVHRPGEQAQSDFTHMNALRITIGGQPFEHMLYHFVLEYSNWENARICFSESYEALSSGMQDSFWKLGAVTAKHRTDRLSAAVNNLSNLEEFTQRYQGLMTHYGVEPTRNNNGVAHENGDIESANGKFKKAVGQELIMRGSCDFAAQEQYEHFLNDLLRRRNSLRRDKLAEDLKAMRPLPANRMEDFTRINVPVSRFSTINVRHNIYSVDSRMIGETANLKVLADRLEVWYGGKCLETLPRLSGEGKHLISYRHIIDSLVRKPGAFSSYKYREALFPTTTFRLAYDDLRGAHAATADRQYLRILYLAAKESQDKVQQALDALIRKGERITSLAVEQALENELPPPPYHTQVDPVDLAGYDNLIGNQEVGG